MSRLRPDRRWVAAVVVAAVVAAGSVAVSPSLGYDSWGWMTWGRELRHGTLNTLSGPSWKPGPSLVAAVISVFTSRHEPAVWLAIVRVAALMSVVVTFVATRELAARTLGVVGSAADAERDDAADTEREGARRARLRVSTATFGALVAAILVATSADLVKTAMYGSSEPFLVLGVTSALLFFLRGRHNAVVGALFVTGLTRPEAWVICGLYALWLWRHGADLRTRAIAVAGTLAAPIIWLGLDWQGSGNLSQSASTAEHLTAGSAARAAFPAGEVFLRGTGTLILPGLVLVGAAVIWAARRRDPLLLVLTGASLLWTLMIGIQAEAGLSGDRRYQAGCAAIMSVVAGVGVARFLGWLAARRVETTGNGGDSAAHGSSPWLRGTPAAVAGALLVLLVGFSLIPLRSDAREIGVSREKDRQLRELRRAVTAVGGPPRVLALGTPVVNPWMQTALAWTLGTQIPRVTAAWSSTKRDPRWQTPAVLFIAPRHYAGTKPAIPAGAWTHELARNGRWRVLEAR